MLLGKEGGQGLMGMGGEIKEGVEGGGRARKGGEV